MAPERKKRSKTLKNGDILKALNNDINNISNNVKYSVGVQLVYTGLLLNKYADLVLSSLSLNIPRIVIIFTLIMHGGSLRVKDLSQLTFRSKQNVSVIIGGLLKSGLVSKQADTKDRRSFRVVVNRKGLDLARRSLPVISAVFTSSFHTLDEKRIQSLNAM